MGTIVTMTNVAWTNGSMRVVPRSYFCELSLCAKFHTHSSITSQIIWVRVFAIVLVICKSKVNSQSQSLDWSLTTNIQLIDSRSYLTKITRLNISSKQAIHRAAFKLIVDQVRTQNQIVKSVVSRAGGNECKILDFQICYVDHIYVQFSMLNLSNIKMIPQYCSYGSAGVPAMPATISMKLDII